MNKKMNIEKLKSEALIKVAILASEKLPENIKRTLTMRLDTILANHSEAFLLDQLYWYLRMLHALKDAEQITEEQFKRLAIDRETLEAILT
jgi:predicted RNA-binding protein associated with RNAse of E/G family